MRSQRLIAAAVVIALSGALAGCSSSITNWDPTDLLDFLDTKKKLPGERKPVFPGGVPGLEQGVPKDLYKGTQQQQDNPNAQAAAMPPQQPQQQQQQPLEPPPGSKQALKKLSKLGQLIRSRSIRRKPVATIRPRPTRCSTTNEPVPGRNSASGRFTTPCRRTSRCIPVSPKSAA